MDFRISISLQTDVDSLVAQQNLSTNSAFESKTIHELPGAFRSAAIQSDSMAAGAFRSRKQGITAAEWCTFFLLLRHFSPKRQASGLKEFDQGLSRPSAGALLHRRFSRVEALPGLL
jgi:hypothetical protein